RVSGNQFQGSLTAPHAQFRVEAILEASPGIQPIEIHAPGQLGTAAASPRTKLASALTGIFLFHDRNGLLTTVVSEE
ncbi:MAG TPA: hypothetical protein VMT22_22740, partial [Terriglobales bacterium]|nr:hypothetical protein [Terriglobales bacterium]